MRKEIEEEREGRGGIAEAEKKKDSYHIILF